MERRGVLELVNLQSKPSVMSCANEKSLKIPFFSVDPLKHMTTRSEKPRASKVEDD